MSEPAKVVLTKAAPSVSLDKHGVTSGLIRVNLNWSAAGAGPSGSGASAAASAPGRRAGLGGLLGRARDALRASAAASADLDLGCMITYRDGRKTAVQAVGDSFGALDEYPYVALDRDDRTGAVAAGENLSVNLAHRAEFAKLLLFVYIYEGRRDFRGLDAVVTLTSAAGDRFEVALDDCPPQAHACAIALIKQQKGELIVQREVRWFTPADGPGVQDVISRAYRLGMKWTPGRK